MIGEQGVILIRTDIIDVANYFLPTAAGWILAALASAFYAATVSGVVRRRRPACRSTTSRSSALKIVAITGVALRHLGVEQDRGFPFAGLLVLVLLIFWTSSPRARLRPPRLRRGRQRRGGAPRRHQRRLHPDRRVRISGAMAALGGIVFASRLRSVDLERRQRHDPARRDRRRGDRRHEPVRRARPRRRGAARRARSTRSRTA